MITKLADYFRDLRDRQRIIIAMTKGTAMMQARNIDLKNPETWEFSGFSQNGEDGIIDVLRSNLSTKNRYFIEIGGSDGMENNSSWLAVAERYNGLMIEGDSTLVKRFKRGVLRDNIGVECQNLFVNRESGLHLKAMAAYHDPDVFSLDIDGNDYYVAQGVFDCGFRPKIFIVEYNSVYGAKRSLTIEYQENFFYRKAHESHLYYGVSIAGWRKFFKYHGYQFVTVDRNGVNAFFVDPIYFDSNFLNGIKPTEFVENYYQYIKFKADSTKQFELIADQRFVSI